MNASSNVTKTQAPAKAACQVIRFGRTKGTRGAEDSEVVALLKRCLAMAQNGELASVLMVGIRLLAGGKPEVYHNTAALPGWER